MDLSRGSRGKSGATNNKTFNRGGLVGAIALTSLVSVTVHCGHSESPTPSSKPSSTFNVHFGSGDTYVSSSVIERSRIASPSFEDMDDPEPPVLQRPQITIPQLPPGTSMYYEEHSYSGPARPSGNRMFNRRAFVEPHEVIPPPQAVPNVAAPTPSAPAAVPPGTTINNGPVIYGNPVFKDSARMGNDYSDKPAAPAQPPAAPRS